MLLSEALQSSQRRLQGVGRDRHAGEKALDQLEAHLDADSGFLFRFDAFGERDRTGGDDHADEVANQLALAFTGLVQIADQ